MDSNKAFDYLYSLYNENILAHSYLLETNNINNCYADLIKLIKKIFSNYANIDELINSNSLPSLISIFPEDKMIKKDAIEKIQERFSVRSQYTDKSIYIIVSPEKMNSTAYNKLLKFLEEPEENIIGFFITDSKEDIAPTIISRCEVFKILYKNTNIKESYNISNEEYDNILNDVKKYKEYLELDYFEAIRYNNDVLLKNYKEKKKIIIFLKLLYDEYHQGNSNYNILKVINDTLYKMQYNLNTNLILDSLALQIGEFYE